MILSKYHNTYLHPQREGDPHLYSRPIKEGLLHTIHVNIYEKTQFFKDYKYFYII